MLIQSFIVAFSMYSKIPMPRIEWNKKNMKYALCFFPAVGIVVGILECLAFWACEACQMGDLFRSVILTIVPILITGGIHMDGYLDTIDALSSNASQEKKLDILKDSNSGAFAIIFGLVYFSLYVVTMKEMVFRAFPFMAVAYVMIRTLSGLSIASFPLAKNTGLAATFQDGAHKKNVKRILMFFFLVEAIIVLWMDLYLGVIVIAVSVFVFLYHYYVCKRMFGGITGDLAGYFLQICELAVAVGLMIGCKVL